MSPSTVVWLGPSATSFSCLCERCLESSRLAGRILGDAISSASVRGEIDPHSAVAFARCEAGHEIVLRRIERPPNLERPDRRQLQLT